VSTVADHDPGVEPELSDLAPTPRPIKLRSSRRPTWWTFVSVPLFLALGLCLAGGSILEMRRETARSAAVRAGTLKPATSEEWERVNGAPFPVEGEPWELVDTSAGFPAGIEQWLQWVGGVAVGTGVCAFAIGVFLVAPARQRRMVRCGRAVRGVVTDARSDTKTYTERKNGFTKTKTVTTHTVTFRYRPEPTQVMPAAWTRAALAAAWNGIDSVEGDGSVTAHTTVSAKQYARLPKWAPVTVLYDPRAPLRPMLYVKSDYVALRHKGDRAPVGEEA